MSSSAKLTLALPSKGRLREAAEGKPLRDTGWLDPLELARVLKMPEHKLGVLLVVAVLAALVWVMVDLGWISLDNPSSNTWIALIMASIVLAIGMYWGILWRRLSGQLEVDDEGEA